MVGHMYFLLTAYILNNYFSLIASILESCTVFRFLKFYYYYYYYLSSRIITNFAGRSV